MPGPLLHAGAVATCPHISGQVILVSSNVRVKVSGMPIVTMIDILTVAGCPPPPTNPKPCVLAKFVPSARIKANLLPVLVYQPGAGICQSADQSPNGPPIVSAIQPRVTGM
ncbi:MAG TPA: hypothetical protein PLI05_05895 [Methanotrichaceae archaeon]|nr:hypothetical protein [Methanotrichaceae archaeon]HQI91215.1 hypothetical protein [Methanotrichaceae archaeon]HQJ61737.1 hypothetical protein [Methanothrix soehngenii]